MFSTYVSPVGNAMLIGANISLIALVDIGCDYTLWKNKSLWSIGLKLLGSSDLQSAICTQYPRLTIIPLFTVNIVTFKLAFQQKTWNQILAILKLAKPVSKLVAYTLKINFIEIN